MIRIDFIWFEVFDKEFFYLFVIDYCDVGMDEYLLGCYVDFLLCDVVLVFGSDYDLECDDVLWFWLGVVL